MSEPDVLLWLDDAGKAIRDTLLADETLVGQLGDAEAVFYQYPATLTPRNFVVLEFLRGGQQLGGTVTNRWKPELQLNVYTRDPRLGARVVRRLLSYAIPQERREPITGEQVTVKGLRYTGTVQVQVPPARHATDEVTHHRVLTATLILDRAF